MGDARLIRKYVCSRGQIRPPMFDVLSAEAPSVYDLWPGISEGVIFCSGGNFENLNGRCMYFTILSI